MRRPGLWPVAALAPTRPGAEAAGAGLDERMPLEELERVIRATYRVLLRLNR